MNRAELLTAALDAVNARPKAYGPPEQNFERIARLWSTHMLNRYGVNPLFDPVDVAAMMALMKIARIEETPDHVDSWVDLAGYAACGVEVATAGVVIEHDADEQPNADLRDLMSKPAPWDFKVGDRVMYDGEEWILDQIDSDDDTLPYRLVRDDETVMWASYDDVTAVSTEPDEDDDLDAMEAATSRTATRFEIGDRVRVRDGRVGSAYEISGRSDTGGYLLGKGWIDWWDHELEPA